MKFSMDTHGGHLVGLYYATGMVLAGGLYSVQVSAIYAVAFFVAINLGYVIKPNAINQLFGHKKKVTLATLSGLSLAVYVYATYGDPTMTLSLCLITAMPALMMASNRAVQPFQVV